MALGYILGKATSKSLNVNLNIPLVLVASVISDIDLLIPGLKHRGPTHSLILSFLIFLPAFLLYRERAAPYFVAVVQHSIPGDYISGEGIQLLWPLTSYWHGVGIELMSFANFALEWGLFLMFITIMFLTRDLRALFQHHASNMFLVIPISTVLLPTLLSFPLSVPLELVAPHVILVVLFALSILVDFRHMIERSFIS